MKNDPIWIPFSNIMWPKLYNSDKIKYMMGISFQNPMGRKIKTCENKDVWFITRSQVQWNSHCEDSDICHRCWRVFKYPPMGWKRYPPRAIFSFWKRWQSVCSGYGLYAAWTNMSHRNWERSCLAISSPCTEWLSLFSTAEDSSGSITLPF